MCQSYWYFIKVLESRVNKYFLHYARYCTFLCNEVHNKLARALHFQPSGGLDHLQEGPPLAHTHAIPESTRDVVDERGTR